MFVTALIHYEDVTGLKKVHAYLRKIWHDAKKSLFTKTNLDFHAAKNG